MRKRFSKKAGSLSWKWRQAISQSERRGWSVKTVLLYPLIKLRYGFRRHQSFMFDFLIAGSNPILSYAAALRLSSAARIEGIKLKIGMLLTDDSDYWPYHSFKTEETWERISCGKSKSFDEFVSSFEIQFSEECGSELVFVGDSDVPNSCRRDAHADGFVIHMTERSIRGGCEVGHALPTVRNCETEIMRGFCEDLRRHAENERRKSYYELEFEGARETTRDSPIPSRLLLSKKLILTSHPTEWIGFSDSVDESSNRSFETEADFAFGSGRKVFAKFEEYEAEAERELLEILSSDALAESVRSLVSGSKSTRD